MLELQRNTQRTALDDFGVYINLAKVGYHQSVLRVLGVGIVREVPYLVTELAEVISTQHKSPKGMEKERFILHIHH